MALLVVNRQKSWVGRSDTTAHLFYIPEDCLEEWSDALLTANPRGYPPNSKEYRSHRIYHLIQWCIDTNRFISLGDNHLDIQHIFTFNLY